DLKGEEPRRAEGTRVEASIDAFLPETYVADPDLKVVLYRRLAETRLPEEVAAIRDEVADRFGRMPEAARSLFDLRELKLLGEACGAESVRIGKGRVRVRLARGSEASKTRVRKLVEDFGEGVSFDAADGLAVEVRPRGRADPIGTARKLLLALSASTNITNSRA
ncbi:MAG: hypothetical protein EHM19_09410, partial [Candidatus Latescibacterota bacterium]